jgi:hypothetical protein
VRHCDSGQLIDIHHGERQPSDVALLPRIDEAQAAGARCAGAKSFVLPVSAEDRLGQGHFVEIARGVEVGESTVDDNGGHAADAVTSSRRGDAGIVHVANFDIVLVAREKLDQFYSLDTAGQPAVKTSIFRR